MNQNFEIPLNTILQERRIAQITNNDAVVKEVCQIFIIEGFVNV